MGGVDRGRNDDDDDVADTDARARVSAEHTENTCDTRKPNLTARIYLIIIKTKLIQLEARRATHHVCVYRTSVFV